MLRKLTLAECDVTWTYEPDQESPDGFFASGDEQQDAADVAEIKRRIASDDLWAWFWVRVVVRWTAHPAWHGDSALGGCSYRDQTDWLASDYSASMVADALDSLNDRLAAAEHPAVPAELDELRCP